ncbi:unnamed protein product, partial [Pylaiella littoralis]
FTHSQLFTCVWEHFDSSHTKQRSRSMGDDLGDDWGVEGIDAGEEGISMVAAEAVSSNDMKKHKKTKTKTKTKKDNNNGKPTASPAIAGRKRSRAQLSAEGFEESDGEGGGTGDEEEEEDDDEEARLKAAVEEQVKALRA